MPVPKQEKSTKRCVLIIEDEKPMARALELKLGSAGFETAVALDGAVALTLLEHERFDCILLDIVMPIMDGLTMLRKLREDPWGKDAPVIVLSNLSDPKTTADAFVHGVHDILVKTDWKLADVIRKVQERLAPT